MAALKRLSQPRFEALLYRRSPIAVIIVEELEWWSTDDESLLGMVARDTIDHDFSYVILGRDEKGIFRAETQETTFSSQARARQAMTGKMQEMSKDGAQVFPQEDNNGKKHEILVRHPDVAEARLHPNFKILTENEHYTPARGIIKELSFAFTDLDGNYRKDFQTTGFDSRLWELYLYAAFYEQRYLIDDEHAVPDFLLQGQGGKIAVEAVTVNPSPDPPPPFPATPAEELDLCRDYMPIKWGSPLFSKLMKRYWEQEHIKGLPLVFAIHDFHAPGSMIWSMPALSDCLFGIRCDEDHRDHPMAFYNWGRKKDIPAGFFLQPEAENVSAVLASNEATLSKFNRMGKIAGFGDPKVRILRRAVILDLDTNKVGMRDLEAQEGEVSDEWSLGLWVYHNPRAKHPLPMDYFPNALNVFLDDQGQRNYKSMRRFHIVRSVTQVRKQ